MGVEESIEMIICVRILEKYGGRYFERRADASVERRATS